MAAIKKCDVRMYRIGTGDCFVLSFKTSRAKKPSFKMMIDCGAQNGRQEVFKKHIDDLVTFVEGEVDVLVITHEHQDHVLGFQRCKDILTDNKKIKFKEVWMAWTEEDGDPMVEDWKKEFGKKKRTLAMASERLMLAKQSGHANQALFKSIYMVGADGESRLKLREDFIDTLAEYTALNVDDNFSAAGDYTGGLVGMQIVKDNIQREKTRYLKPGTILDDLEGLDNIRIHVLGPPHNWTDVKTEHGKDGETYKHNKELELVRGFSSFDLYTGYADTMEDAPFSRLYVDDSSDSPIAKTYENPGDEWRRIDFDWLFSAGELSLRLTRGINNLSLVLAIEFVDSGKVMLFPGDAEFGSWRSWHEINWPKKGKDDKHLTEDLLNRTVFYKVAHHMSHNGTAKEKGLDMMLSPDLVAMGTVNYDVISPNWQNTMPNRAIVRDLLDKTKGRLIIMNTKDIFFDKQKKIPIKDEIERRLTQMPTRTRVSYEKDLDLKNPLYYEYTVDGR